MNLTVWQLIAEIARINQSDLSDIEKARLKAIILQKLREVHSSID